MKIWYNDLKLRVVIVLQARPIYIVAMRADFLYNGVNRTEQIREEGAARNADIIMFGHTHRPYFEERDGITVLNPGSLSFPRQEGRKSSYMILETDGEEKYEFVQHFL